MRAPLAVSIGLCALCAAAAAPASAAIRFENPRHTIACAVSKAAARCDIRSPAWDPPPKPDWCTVDWGNGLEVDRRGVAGFTCAGDTVFGAKRVVGYGRSVRRGRFECTVRRNGVRCVNTRNEHGFELAKRFARWF